MISQFRTVNHLVISISWRENIRVLKCGITVTLRQNKFLSLKRLKIANQFGNPAIAMSFLSLRASRLGKIESAV